MILAFKFGAGNCCTSSDRSTKHCGTACLQPLLVKNSNYACNQREQAPSVVMQAHVNVAVAIRCYIVYSDTLALP